MRKSIGKYQPFFRLHYYKSIGEKPPLDETLCSFAQPENRGDGQIGLLQERGTVLFTPWIPPCERL